MLQKQIEDFCNKLGVYRVYSLVRRYIDCMLVVTIGSDLRFNTKDEIKAFYDKTIDKVEEFSLYYFDNLIDIYIKALPELKYSRFASESNFRNQVLRNRTQRHFVKLTDAHGKVLYWSRQGKSSDEIAIILDISPYTVKDHRKSILEKLNATNMV